MEKDTPKTHIECGVKYEFSSGPAGEGQIRLNDSTFQLLPKQGNALTYSYREIHRVQAQDYQVNLTLAAGSLRLYHLGRQYSDCLRILISQRNELILTDLLMQEKVKRGGIRAEVVRLANPEEVLGNSELRLCETALLIIPEFAEPLRLPLSYINEIEEEGYTLTIKSEAGTFCLRKLGREFSPFSQLLAQAVNELAVAGQTLLRELAPMAGADAIHRASKLMGEGRAATREKLDQIDVGIWKSLESRLDNADLKPEYNFLSAAGGGKLQAIGFKKEQVATAGSEYIWFLIPIPKKNLIAMEASSGPGGGRATYFFTIVPRSHYKGLKPPALQEQAETMLAEINRAMLAINFRREPIYLPSEKLLLPQYQKYLFAVQRIPQLQLLRERFVGRVFHRDLEQWEQDVRDLFSFNIAAADAAVWSKSDMETPEDGVEENENGG